MIPWHSAGPLILDRDGVLWHWTDPGLVRLGPIDFADTSAEFDGERAELLDLWSDRIDDRGGAGRGGHR